MRGLALFAITLYLSAVSLLANISFNLPCKNVAVTKEASSTVFKGSDVSGEPGQPQLPVYTCVFVIPPDADLNSVSFSISGLKEEILGGTHSVKPAPPLVSGDGVWWPPRRNIVDGKDVGVYSTDAFFPNNYIGKVKVGKLYCYKVVHVSVYLSKYNPVTKKLKQMKNGELLLQYAKTPGYDSKRNASYRIPVNVKKRVKNIVVNYEEIAGEYDSDFTFVNRSKYAIITTASIQSGSSKLSSLIASKELRGFDVEVVTQSTWGNNADDLRSWLQSNYESMGIEYVLLIGDPHPTSGDVPMKVVSYSQGSGPTDFYFAQLTGSFSSSDGDAEVSVGRIPVYNDDYATLDDILDKCVRYENVAISDILWRTNALLIAKPFDDNTPGNYLFEAIKEDFIDPNGWDNFRIYDDDYGDPDIDECSQSAVIDAWSSEPFGFVEWMTHGSQTGASSIMSSSATSQLGNEYNPIVFMGSCSNSYPEADDNLAYSMLKNASIASIAATRTSYYSPGQTSFDGRTSIQGFIYELACGIVADSLGAGDALNQIKSKGSSSSFWVNYCVFNLYGCPDLSVFTCISQPFINVSSPNGGEEWERGFSQEIKWGDNIDGNVKIELFKGSSLKETLAASTESDGKFEWSIPGNYEVDSDYKVKITSIDSTALNDESDANFSITEEYIIICPYFQPFDTLDTGTTTLPEKWEQLSGDDLQWTVWSGLTPSKYPDQGAATGPDGDHTSGNGNYIYVESSNPNNPDKNADYVTPKFNFKNLSSPELIIWYHMFSDNDGEDQMGDLYLDISVDGTWHNDVFHLTDDHGDQWIEQKVDLTPYYGDRVIFRFRAITGSGWASDICIDDFEIDGVVAIDNTFTNSTSSYDLKFYNSRLHFHVPNSENTMQQVTIKLYNIQGKLIGTLMDGKVKSGGHAVSLSKVFNGGHKLAAGLYLCKMEAGEFTKTINLIIRK